MNRERVAELLRAVADGSLEPRAAAERLATLPYADLGFARLDLFRDLSAGVPEVVFGESKSTEQLIAICRRFLEEQERVLVTRVAEEAAAQIAAEISSARYHRRARVLTVGEPPPRPGAGGVAVVSAGTSDLGVAEEAAVCLEWFGHRVSRHPDVGVAGLHRLLGELPSLREVELLIVVAGMDGALPSVVGNLVAAPVIAVPTSVGYGSSFEGLAALLTMLNSCASGIGVVNIDNGFGAAVLAHRILSRAAAKT